MEEYIENVSDMFQVKLVAKSISLESPGSYFMHMRIK